MQALRQSLINTLWQRYRAQSTQIQCVEQYLIEKNICHLPLDHFAVIDLPGPHSGIPFLRQIFKLLGFVERGKGYLPDKQNDFMWMADTDSLTAIATDALPQVVIADFRLHDMPSDIRHIIEHYSHQATPFPFEHASELINKATQGCEEAQAQVMHVVTHYLSGRDWPLPTMDEFSRVREFNELLAWVLVFGRQPNHFTLSIHLLGQFNDLAHFHDFITETVKLPLNEEGGAIKGTPDCGIVQGSTVGIPEQIPLADGSITLPTGFIEFVWRYPHSDSQPVYWRDYFTDFIAHHANHVIESLYEHDVN